MNRSMKFLKRYSWCIFLVLSMMQACSVDEKPDISIIPQPAQIDVKRGHFSVNENTRILLNAKTIEVRNLGQDLKNHIRMVTGMNLQMEEYKGSAGSNELVLSLNDELFNKLGDEGYMLQVDRKRINIEASAPAGLFYGMQTLYQLMPVEIFAQESVAKTLEWQIPCVEIFDKPRFSWRGMHLDVSRHFFPKAFIKRYIDLIAMHKMNVFHWHLTDDNGWRMEIMKYPKLTEVSAWRVDREHQPWREVEPPEPGEKSTYGGFYTQADIEEIIEYAHRKHVTIIPEIELPGHTSEVFAAYPELSCRGEKLYVQPGTYWPNLDIFCAGKEETFEFLEHVLLEVATIFPSEYIHIGGDEANKTRWKECKYCQQRIKDEGLANEDELQSYFIKRIEKFLQAQDKKLIGWDEILEGGLAPEATVMSWRGFEGGIEAAQQGHDVIMCPISHCYFDYYQADPEFQPKAIGGFTTLKKVYSFEPVPPVLNAEESGHILGAQGNVWTEYIPTPEHAEYMALPRMTALAEVAWTEQQNKSWPGFQHRLQQHFQRLDMMEVNYCEGSYRVNIVPLYNYQSGTYNVQMESEIPGAEIRYTLDGSVPEKSSPKYSELVELNSATTITAVIYNGSEIMEKPVVQQIDLHLAVGAKVTYAIEPNYKYPGQGEMPLVNGVYGSLNHTDGHWQAFQGDDFEVLIDLGETREFNKISVNFLQKQRSWIFLPSRISCAVSTDGENFETMKDIEYQTIESDEIKAHPFLFSFENPMSARYVKIRAENMGTVPDWHWGKGGKAWLFIDEISIH